MKSKNTTRIYYTLLSYRELIIGLSGILSSTDILLTNIFIENKYTKNFERELKKRIISVFKKNNRFEDIQVSRDDDLLSDIVEQLKEYLDGKRKSFNISFVLNINGFRRKILLETAKIPYGSVRTYREVAELVGNPRASRACGSALANNPLPLIIPCHRVIKSNGEIGQFGPGQHVKAMLLKLEGVLVNNNRLLKKAG